VNEVIYASWGGNGRGLALRSAFEAAIERDAPLLYLGIIDRTHFGDLDDGYISLIAEELEWLLDAQLRLVADQLGVGELDARILVRSGAVIEEITQAAAASSAQLVMIPDEVSDQRDTIASATGVPVELV